MHNQFVRVAVPDHEGDHDCGDEETGDDGVAEGFVEGEDAVEDGGGGYQHRKIVAPLCVVLQRCMEKGGAYSYACQS